ncbi:MAG: transglycosylase SLT domain-containing protein [Rickettsiales bacterium]
MKIFNNFNYIKKLMFITIFCNFFNNIIFAFDYQLKQAQKCLIHVKKYEFEYRLPKDMLFAITLKETGRRYSGKINLKPYKQNTIAWPWAVNFDGQGYYFENKEDAVNFVKKQLKSGNSNIDVGCAQINLRAHPFAFRSVEESLDPNANVNYAAYLLRKNYNTYKNWFKSIAVYHSKTEKFGIKYANSVLEILNKIYKYN